MNTGSVYAASSMQGFGYVTSAQSSFTLGGFNLGAGAASSITSQTLTAQVADASSLSLIKYSGVNNANVNNRWMLVPGESEFTSAAPNAFRLAVVIERTTGGQIAKFQFYNPTGATVTIPSITTVLKSYFYTAPW